MWLLDLIAEKPSYFVVFFSLVNGFIALKSYKTNKNNSLPKISIIPFQRLVEDEFVHYSNPWHRLSNEVYYDEFTNRYRFGKRGFPRRDFTHDGYDWFLSVSNKSDYPATYLVIKYKLIIDGRKYFTPDEQVLSSENIGDYEEIKITINFEDTIDYLAPGETKEIFVTDLFGAFLSADLYLVSVKSKEKKYIQKQVKIDSYEHLKIANHRFFKEEDYQYQTIYLNAAFGFTDDDMENTLSTHNYFYFLKHIKSDGEEE